MSHHTTPSDRKPAMKEFSQSTGEALPADTHTDAGEEFTRMDRRLLVPSLTNRPPIALEKLQAMAATMAGGRGVRQALIVRPLPGARVPDTRLNTPKGQPLPTHEIVCGEQRWLAAGLAQVKDLPVIVRDLSDAQALEEQFIENFQRQNFTELEEGEGFQRLMQHNHLTADQVAAKVGCSRRHVFNRIKLLDLRIEARKALLAGDIDATRALLLARIPDHTQQLKALPLLKKHEHTGEFTLTVRQATDTLERDFMLELSKARFKITDITLVPEAGNCMECHKRTGHNPDLFADIKGANICTDPPCYQRKQDAYETRVMQEAHANGQTVITGREAKALMPNSFGGIEGFLRLDDAKDSPTDKPLRKLLGNLLEKDDIKPTLVENPHQKGDLIAVLPAQTVRDLLNKRGHKVAAALLETQNTADSKAQAEADKARDKADKIHAYEQGWRDEVLAQTYALICAGPHKGQEDLSDEVLRIIASRLASQANGEQTRQLCALLGLGKIAPREALADHCRTASQPERLVLLLVMHHDVAFKDFQPDPAATNPGLLQVASDYGIDVDAVQAGVKQAMRAKTGSKVQAPDAVSADLPPQGGGGAKPKAAAPTRKTRTSAAEASQGIAAAMQGIEASAHADAGNLSDVEGMTPELIAKLNKAGVATRDDLAELALEELTEITGQSEAEAKTLIMTARAHWFADDAAAPVNAAGGTPLAVGLQVTVTSDTDRLGMTQQRFAGKRGHITRREDGGGFWDVTFKGRTGGVAMFAEEQLSQAA